LNKNILNTGVQVFINNNLNTDILSVALSKPVFEGISQQELLQQLEAKKKCRLKLPTWYHTPGIFYPKKVSIEQSSSEKTARYKAGLVSGKRLADLSGGFGVDAYFFSKVMEQVSHCEIDEELHSIVTHNYGVLGSSNIETHHRDGIGFIKNCTTSFDWIYLDPSRRDPTQKRVFLLSDCSPNVVEHLDLLFEKGDRILLKTAPLLDITAGMQELRNVTEIHIVAVNNEVKELLWILDRQVTAGETLVKTINFTNHGEEVFSFPWEQEKRTLCGYSEPLTFLYEPNAAIMKSGGYKVLGHSLGLKKLQEHSHLYTCHARIPFPGRAFKVLEVLPATKTNLKKLSGTKANITTRNYPESVARLRKRLKIKEGGDTYLFFTTDHHGRHMALYCEKA